ncbi:MAG: LysR family transcriptional regulator [Eubacteriales bacterium]|nr:LysR family transcriptional regulator [Eubacteriales bacterium]
MKESVRLIIKKDEKFFGPGIATLLHLVDKHGSIQAACAMMDMSYSKAWKIIKRADQALGFPLLLSQNGGKEGGRSSLTEEGRRFLQCYDQMNEKLCAEAERLLDECFSEFLTKPE